MFASDLRSTEPLRHGAYLCLGPSHRARRVAAEVRALIERLELRNEAEPGGDHPARAIAFLRRVDATPAPRATDVADDALRTTEAMIHVAAPAAEPVATLCAELTRLLAPAAPPRVLGGIVRPMNYTGNLMHDFAYGRRVLQQPASVAPHAFFVPLRKTAAWWQKDWMERHTYFLPRYDDAGRMRSEGHVLASAGGISSLMRRTYKQLAEPAPAGAYDFLTYFECSDAGVARFHEVCAALRDVARNPEWAFVEEGPTWHGRRVATWDDLLG